MSKETTTTLAPPPSGRCLAADRSGPSSFQRRHPLPDLRQAGFAPHHGRGKARNVLWSLGAQRQRGFRGRRLQWLGHAIASPAGARKFRYLGRLCARSRQGRAVQVPHRLPQPGTRWGEGRPVRHVSRAAAANGIRGVGPGISVGRQGMDGNAGEARVAAGADFRLRSSSRFLDASAGRRQPAADLSRNRAAPGGICEADEFYPRGADAHHGASVLRVLGISDDGIFRAHLALRHAAGFHVPGGLPAPERHWSDSGLGAVALPYRRPRPGLFRRHASVRACRRAQGFSSRLEDFHLQLRPQRSAQFSDGQRPVLAGQVSH